MYKAFYFVDKDMFFLHKILKVIILRKTQFSMEFSQVYTSCGFWLSLSFYCNFTSENLFRSSYFYYIYITR